MSAELEGVRADGKVEPEALRVQFIGWQCWLRQHAVRREAGRPTDGMKPRLEVEADGPVAPALTVLIVEREPRETTARFRHIIRQTNDPRNRYKKALELLGARYYQYPRNFSGVMTALFGPGSATADCLTRLGRCVLHFEQSGQYFQVPCRVEALKADDPAFQATFWHNSMFNPDLSADVQVLAFQPNWERASARPAGR